jgi:hypothetical protein
MNRQVFFSFHYLADCWRASQVRNIGAIESNAPVSDNDWEAITKKGDIAIQNWIDNQLEGRSCSIVLIGTNTAGRKWIKYEIKKSWDDGKGVLGIYIHNLEDNNHRQSSKGRNPFEDFTVRSKDLSSIVRAYDPPYWKSTDVYAYIKNNISDWVEEAISIRNSY